MFGVAGRLHVGIVGALYVADQCCISTVRKERVMSKHVSSARFQEQGNRGGRKRRIAAAGRKARLNRCVLETLEERQLLTVAIPLLNQDFQPDMWIDTSERLGSRKRRLPNSRPPTRTTTRSIRVSARPVGPRPRVGGGWTRPQWRRILWRAQRLWEQPVLCLHQRQPALSRQRRQFLLS